MVPKLHEVKLSILNHEECSDLGKEMEVNVTLEFCAGNKNYFPKVEMWKRIKNTRKNRYYFKRIKIVTNYLGMKNPKYNFYLGGKDTCQGKFLICLNNIWNLYRSWCRKFTVLVQ